MPSLRARLFVFLLALAGIAAGAVAGATYVAVRGEIDQLFDYQLRQMALSLRDQGEIAAGDAAALSDEDLDFVVQIWHIDGRVVYSTRAHRALPSRTVLGFADLLVEGVRWRSFGVAARDRVIQVAQPVAIRQGLAARAALRSLLPLVAVAPLLAAALWWLIDHSLKPLSRMAQRLREADVATLQPLPEAGLPEEVAPLVKSLNAMLLRLAESFEHQRAFVADAAHELRSPLTALTLQARLLQRAGEDEAARGVALEALVAGIERSKRLVEQLLTLARQEPGAAPVPMAPVALAPLLRQGLADAAALAQARGSRLSLQVAEGLEAARVQGDAAALAVLLRNLVDNALRYTPEGGEVQVSLGAAGERLRLRVDDDGPGIPAAERERVLERFVRGSGAAEASGSGLGLAIVRSIAQRHGASLRLAESPSGGLRVELGFVRLDDQPPASPVSAA